MLDLTGSGKIIAYFLLASMLPSLIMVPLSGVIGDRLNRKHVMMAMDFTRGCLILFLTIVFSITNHDTRLLFIITIFMGIMDSIYNASNSAFITELVNKSDYIKGNSFMSYV